MSRIKLNLRWIDICSKKNHSYSKKNAINENDTKEMVKINQKFSKWFSSLMNEINITKLVRFRLKGRQNDSFWKNMQQPNSMVSFAISKLDLTVGNLKTEKNLRFHFDLIQIHGQHSFS